MSQITILENINEMLKKLPESVQIEVLHYIENIGSQYTTKINENTSNACLEYRPQIPEEERPKKRRSGILKGTFVLPLPDDFDEALEDFNEYI